LDELEVDLRRAGNQPGDAKETAPASAKDAFAGLYEQYMPMVFKYISYRIRETHTAEDLTSAVFEKALTRFQTFKSDRASFSTWIMTIARNTLTDYFRASARKQTVPIDDADPVTNGNGKIENGMIKREQIKHLQQCLGKLSSQEQEIISLKFSGEMTNRQIAGMLGISESNVGTIVYRAVRKLRDSFGEWQ
jgi:RNA polymerase sigma-70 factor (ECF subfamily)